MEDLVEDGHGLLQIEEVGCVAVLWTLHHNGVRLLKDKDEGVQLPANPHPVRLLVNRFPRLTQLYSNACIIWAARTTTHASFRLLYSMACLIWAAVRRYLPNSGSYTAMPASLGRLCSNDCLILAPVQQCLPRAAVQ